MKEIGMKSANWLGATLLCALLAACGGSGGSGGSDGGGGGGGTTDPIEQALQSGDPTALTAKDSATLLARAVTAATALGAKQTQALASIYSTDIMDLSLNHSTNCQF